MNNPRELPRDVGEFIRDLRRNARISLRQLAEQAGVSNPYLSQIERGLRKPSAAVLSQLANALRVSTPLMYLRAGLLDLRDGQGVLAAITADPDLTVPQKQSLTQIYETFRRENARAEAEPAETEPADSTDHSADHSADHAARRTTEPATEDRIRRRPARTATPRGTRPPASRTRSTSSRSTSTPSPHIQSTPAEESHEHPDRDS